jgi:PhzF family phenazine biosynthesis protein
MTAGMRQWTIDAFADRPFRGNPACVVEPFDAWPDPAWMQALAQENNQAETAFLLRTADPARFGLRWFTPAVEVKLCGHATLASTHAITAELGEGAELLTFDTLSGALTVSREGDGYRMNFPADAPRQIDEPTGLAEVLGVTPLEVWTGQYGLAILDSESTVRALKPDLPGLCGVDAAAGWGPGHLIVAAVADPASPYQVVSRFFGPGSGIDEDPTTGSAHCLLAPLFIDKLGLERVAFHQAYPGRGGDVVCEQDGDRVLISGRAVTVMESRLRI